MNLFGSGNLEADLMLIGEAPGAEEDKVGKPFVGAAGILLNKMLNAIDCLLYTSPSPRDRG